MPRGKVLSEFERGQIDALKKSNKNVSKMSKLIRKSRKVISKYLRDPKKYGNIRRKPKRYKITPKDHHKLIRLASNSTKSINQLKAELGLSACKETVRKALHKSPHIIRAKILRAPNLTPIHKIKRVEFAKLNMGRQWSDVSTLEKPLVSEVKKN